MGVAGAADVEPLWGVGEAVGVGSGGVCIEIAVEEAGGDEGEVGGEAGALVVGGEGGGVEAEGVGGAGLDFVGGGVPE